MTKPRIYKVPGQYACSMYIEGFGPVHGYGATMRAAFFDFCIVAYNVRAEVTISQNR